jgi:hypothetical protein
VLDESRFKTDNICTDDGYEVVILAVESEGRHRLDRALFCNLAQCINVNLLSSVSRRQHAENKWEQL